MNKFDFLKIQPLNLLDLELKGKRVNLVAISDKFELDIFREFTHEITRYMFPSSANSIEEIQDFIAKSRCDMQNNNDLQFVILDKQLGGFLGCCALHGQDRVREPELGIWIKKSSHGNGYGREAIDTLVDWARNNILLDCFIYPVDRHNIASRKIPESLGGQIVKELKVETPTGKILDEVIYKIESIAKTNQV
jgi:[ribosomal protein S5]-alanine N-acetyltransferase